jgi:hypothetical protein
MASFLNFYKTSENNPTHTRIGDKHLNIYGGKYLVNDNNKFLEEYFNNIVSLNKVEYVTEKQLDNGPIAIDLDFRYNHDVNTRQHNKAMINDIIVVCIDLLTEFYNFTNETSFEVFVMEKPNVNRLADGSFTKDGIHIIIGLNMVKSFKIHYRNKLLHNLPEYVGLPLINTFESVVDKPVLEGSTNWQLFGSRKPGNESYQLTSQYVITFDENDKEFMMTEQTVGPINLELLKKLSVRNNDRPFVEPKNNSKSNFRPISPTSVTEIQTEIFTNETFKINESDNFYKYLNCIGNKMCDRGQHKETITILQILKNENLDIKYVKYWIQRYAYPDSKKYNYAISYYENGYIKPTPLSNEKRLTIKTLIYYAKKYNQELYSTYFNDDYDFRIKKLYNFDTILVDTTEAFMMKLYYDMKKDRILFKDDKIYLYYNDEWHIMCEKGRMVKNDMLEFYIIYLKACLDIINNEDKLCIENLNEDKKELIKMKRKVCNTLRIDYSKNTTLNHTFSLLLNKLACDKCDIEFDVGVDNYYNIQFKNGVYDLKNKKFRSRIQTDYVTKYLNYDFIEIDNIDSSIQNEVLNFFQKVQPDKAQCDFTLGYLAYCITGDATKQIFKMNIGHTASNGKSTELAIHEKCFDIYTEKLDNRVLLLGFEKRHKHIINLVKQPVRLVYFEEMPKGKNLDVEFIKDFVDGKKIDCEIMFGTKDKIKIQAKIMSVSNHDFKCDTDEGILRRGRVQKYESKFVEKNEVNELKHIFEKIEGFENKFDDVIFKNAYFHLLLKYIDNLHIPKINKDEFKKTAEESDTILNDLLEHFEFTNDEKDFIGKNEIDKLCSFNKDKFNEYKSKLQSKGCKYNSQGKYYNNDENKWKSGIFIKIKIHS